MKTIYCVRHAITDAHVEARKKSTLGFIDVGLNEQGRQDANKLIENFRSKKIDGILSSDLKSSLETAQILNTYFNVPMYVSDMFRERNQGEYCGKELRELYSENSGFNITTAGAERESLRDFMNRTKNAFSRITSDFTWDACILVSHKGFLQTMSATCLNIRPSNWYLCEVRILSNENGKWIQK